MLPLIITGFIEFNAFDIIDILLVAVLLYQLFRLLRGTVAVNIFYGILAVFLLWKVVDALGMKMLSGILGAFFSVGFIALIVIFQPEIRQFLLALGRPGFINKKGKRGFFWRFTDSRSDLLDIDRIVLACQRMAQEKQGALIVLARQNELLSIQESGERINSDLSVDLLINIFYPNSPLHDGAVIINHNKISAARCVLPVSKSTDIPNSLGLRHRAAVGVTENSDAIAVIVSEQTGKISYSISGQLKRSVQPAQLQKMLIEEFGCC